MSNFLVVVGFALLANAVWMAVQRVSAGSAATGRVVDHEARNPGATESSSAGTTLYHAVIEFTDSHQRPHRFTTAGGDSRRQPPRGRQVQVRYRAADPELAYLATFANTWVMPMVWGVAGAIALYFGHTQRNS